MDTGAALNALVGGVIIGLAVTFMLLFNGRVTGISGIISGFITSKRERLWQGAFVAGLVLGGLVVRVLSPDSFVNLTERSYLVTILAGLFVGFGTVMGSGCTSGHGVCGVSRMSVRSVVATATFMAAGILSVAAVRFIWGGAI